MKRSAKRPNSSDFDADNRQARPMPTMSDLARVTGFSQMTVSRAFFPSALIRRETKQSILKAAVDIGYFHNKAAASLASNNSRAFGIILPALQGSTYLPVVGAARRVFEREGFQFFLKTRDHAL